MTLAYLYTVQSSSLILDSSVGVSAGELKAGFLKRLGSKPGRAKEREEPEPSARFFPPPNH